MASVGARLETSISLIFGKVVRLWSEWVHLDHQTTTYRWRSWIHWLLREGNSGSRWSRCRLGTPLRGLSAVLREGGCNSWCYQYSIFARYHLFYRHTWQVTVHCDVLDVCCWRHSGVGCSRLFFSVSVFVACSWLWFSSPCSVFHSSNFWFSLYKCDCQALAVSVVPYKQ